MSGDEGEESAMDKLMAKQRSEKKDLQAQLNNLKKTAKSGNKKQQKEASEECTKREKEMEERHKKERDACMKETRDTVEEEKKEKEVDKGEGNNVNTSFYKENTVKGKAQKRQEKKAEEMKKRAEAAAMDEENAKTSLRTTEMEAFKKILSSRGLSSVDIPSDGDCLFHAIAHQLNNKKSVSHLRRLASSYIRSHKDDFLPFLSSDDGEVLDEVQFDEYCVNVEREASLGGHWGGEPELRAMAEVLEKKIEVIQPDSRVVTFGDSFSGRPLIITFHRHTFQLGEHYNSTIPISQTV